MLDHTEFYAECQDGAHSVVTEDGKVEVVLDKKLLKLKKCVTCSYVTHHHFQATRQKTHKSHQKRDHKKGEDILVLGSLFWTLRELLW